MGVTTLRGTGYSQVASTLKFTWATKPSAANFGVGQAWFSDINAFGLSDGVNWSILREQRNNRPNMMLTSALSETTTGFTVFTNNGSSITNSNFVDAKGVTRNAVLISCPVNNPSSTPTIAKDLTVKFSEDTSVPLFFVTNVPRLPVGTNLQCYPWISNTTSLGSANRSRFITPANYDKPGVFTHVLDKRDVNTAALGAMYIEQQGTAAFSFASNLGSFRHSVSGSSSVDLRAAMVYQLGEGLRERAKVCITFDDSLPTAYHVGYKEAKKRGIAYTNFAIFDSLSATEGSATGMTVDQIREIANDPLCYVGLHGNAAFDGTGTGAGLDPYTEMKRNIDGLKALNLSDCLYMSWPNGGMGHYVGESVAVDPAKRLGILGARWTQYGYQYFNGGLYNPYCISSYGLKSTTTLAQAKAVIDQAILWGCAVTFYGHNLDAAADSLTWVTSDYIDLLDYIATKRSLGLIDDMRFDDFMRHGASL